MKRYDALVIGGGPAGATAALYLCRSGLRVALAEKLAPGGQTLNTDSIENYPGFPRGIKGYELADLFAAHLEGLELDRYNDAVQSLEHSPAMNRAVIGKESLEARSVILCSGVKPRLLGLPEEERFIGRGLSFCALCDGNFYRNQTIAVVGGGNSALEEALYLSRIVGKIYLVHRRDSFRGAKIYEDKIRAASNIELVLDSVITALHGENGVQAVSVRNLKSGAESRLDVEGVFLFVGHAPQNDFFPPELELNPQGFVITDGEMRTNLPGIFAAGDIRAKNCRQVATAVGDGATAATAAFSYLEHN